MESTQKDLPISGGNSLYSLQNVTTITTIATLTTISASALFFGWWFATQQVTVVAPDAMQTYPWLYFASTIFKCYLTIISLFLVSSILLTYVSNNKISLFWIACSFLPLLASFIVQPFYWLAVSVITLQVGLLIAALRANDYYRLANQYLFDFLILIVFFLLHYVLTTRLSPSHWNMVLFTATGQTSEEAYVLAPIYRGFLLAKQFAFDNIDHSQWAGIMNTPVALTSPLMQLATFILDLPSVSIESFHQVLSAINFTLVVLGSFGCYLFLRHAAKISIMFAFLGGFLYFFSCDPHLDRMFTTDAGIFLSSYAVFPYALLLISLAYQKNNYLYALWAGVALASQFFFIYPHPEAVIYSFFFFGIYSVGLYLYSPNVSTAEKRKYIIFAVATALCLSAFIFAPVIYDRLSQNMYVFAHTGDITSADFIDFKQYTYIILAAIVINLVLSRTAIKTTVYKASFLLSAAIFMILLISMNKMLLKVIAKKVHIGLHFWFTWRYGMYFCFMTTVIAMYALDGMLKNIKYYIWETK